MADARCPSCGQSFKSQAEADEHQRQMHAGKKGGERTPEPRERKEIPPEQ
jgi:uncharacterized C2H2 Zn-finger protein